MGFNFIEEVLSLGGATTEPTFRFYKKGFCLGGGKITPTWQDVVISGNGSLTLANAKADGLNYLKLFGGTELLPETYIDSVTAEGKCEQNGTPSPSQPVDIWCNNGKLVMDDVITQIGKLYEYATTTEYNPSDGKISARVQMNYSGSFSLGSPYSRMDGVNLASYWEVNISGIQFKSNSTSSIFKLYYGQNYSYIELSWSPSGYEGKVEIASGGSYKSRFTPALNTKYDFKIVYDGITTLTTTYKLSSDTNWTVLQNRSNKITDNGCAMIFIGNRNNSVDYPIGSLTYINNTTTKFGQTTTKQLTVTGTTETVTDSLGNVATCTNLLSVGSYKDTQEVISGAITRNIGIKVLDGTEDWQIGGNNTGVYMALGASGSFVAGVGYCTHSIINPNSPNIVDMNQNDFCLYSNGNMSFKNAYTTSTTDWKTYLANQYTNGTPVVIVYALATATTETVTGQFLSKSPVTYAGSISGLTGTVVETSHSTPTPTQPLQINCNNGVVKVRQNLWKGNYSDRGYLDTTGVVIPISGYMTSDFIEIDENKKYTFYEQVILNYTGNGMHICFYNASQQKVGERQGGDAKEAGDYAYVATPPTNAKYIRVSTGVSSANVSNITLVEGEYDTTTIQNAIGSTYVDGTTETVEIHSKNLANFVSGNIVLGYAIDNSTGQQQSTPSVFNFYCPQYIPIQGGESYVFCGRKSDNTLSIWNRIHWYDSSKTFISTCSYTQRTVTIATAPVNASYARISCNPLDNGATLTQAMVDEFNWVFEQGTTEPDYTPYFNGGNALAEPLYAVGTYKDVQSVLDGSVTRNVGALVLDGTESWQGSDGTPYYINIPQLVGATSRVGLSNYFECTNTNAGQAGKFHFGGATVNGNVIFSVEQTWTTKNAFTAWLADQYNAGNPVIVIYPLATATTESVTAQPLTTQSGTNIVEITQASMSNLPLEVSYKAGVTVTITEVQNANLNNSVTVTIS